MLTFRDIANHARDENAFLRLERAKRDFCGEFSSIFAQTVEFEASSCPHWTVFGDDEEFGSLLSVLFPQPFRQKRLHFLVKYF